MRISDWSSDVCSSDLYSVFAAHLCFKSWTRRIVFVAAALATTILANALRAYGTMVAAEIWGIEAAGGIDHIFYGWIFFGLVILLVLLVALRWFDRPANDVAVDVGGLPGRTRFAGPAEAVEIGRASGWERGGKDG